MARIKEKPLSAAPMPTMDLSILRGIKSRILSHARLNSANQPDSPNPRLQQYTEPSDESRKSQNSTFYVPVSFAVPQKSLVQSKLTSVPVSDNSQSQKSCKDQLVASELVIRQLATPEDTQIHPDSIFTSFQGNGTMQVNGQAICSVCNKQLGESLEEMREHAEKCEAEFNEDHQSDEGSNLSSPPESLLRVQKLGAPFQSDNFDIESLNLPPAYDAEDLTQYPEFLDDKTPEDSGGIVQLAALTPVEVFAKSLANLEDMDYETLYHTCLNIQEAMTDYQDEWMTLDEAVKRNLAPVNIPGKNLESAESKKARTPINPRAPKTTNDFKGSMGQDIIESLAYGYEHKTHVASIGRQNPIAQRIRTDGDGPRPQRNRQTTNNNGYDEDVTEPETATELDTGPGRRATTRRRYALDESVDGTQRGRSRETPGLSTISVGGSPGRDSSKGPQRTFPSGKPVGRPRSTNPKRSNLIKVHVQEDSDDERNSGRVAMSFKTFSNNVLNGLGDTNGVRGSVGHNNGSRPSTSSSNSSEGLSNPGLKRKAEELSDGDGESDESPNKRAKGKPKSLNRSKGATKGWEKRRETMRRKAEENSRGLKPGLYEMQALSPGSLMVNHDTSSRSVHDHYGHPRPFPDPEFGDGLRPKKPKQPSSYFLEDSDGDEGARNSQMNHSFSKARNTFPSSSKTASTNGDAASAKGGRPKSNDVDAQGKKIKHPVGTTKASQNMLNRWKKLREARAAGVEPVGSIGRKKDESKKDRESKTATLEPEPLLGTPVASKSKESRLRKPDDSNNTIVAAPATSITNSTKNEQVTQPEAAPRTSGRAVKSNPKYASSQETVSSARPGSSSNKMDDLTTNNTTKKRQRSQDGDADVADETTDTAKPVKKSKIITLPTAFVAGLVDTGRITAGLPLVANRNGARPQRKSAIGKRLGGRGTMDGANDSDGEEANQQIGREFKSEYEHFQALTSPQPPFLGKRVRKPVINPNRSMRAEMSEEESGVHTEEDGYTE